MSFSKRLFALVTLVGVSIVGLGLTSFGAGAAVATAQAKVTVGSKAYTWSGQTCPTTVNSPQYILMVGKGGKDSLELIGKVSGGRFKNANIALVKGSFYTALTKNSGTITAKGGTFKGTDVYGKKVSGTFTC
jgi:hypothetical protein